MLVTGSKKLFARVYPKQMSNNKLSHFFLRFRGYRILQQLIGSCISLFSDVNINFLGTLSRCLNRANKEIAVHTEVLNT